MPTSETLPKIFFTRSHFIRRIVLPILDSVNEILKEMGQERINYKIQRTQEPALRTDNDMIELLLWRGDKDFSVFDGLLSGAIAQRNKLQEEGKSGDKVEAGWREYLREQRERPSE